MNKRNNVTTSIEEPVYKITCHACHKDNLYSILDMLHKTRVHCSCYEAIEVADHYRRPEIAEFLKRAGRLGPDGFFAGVSDSKWFLDHAEVYEK
jgi:hypothetical protein